MRLREYQNKAARTDQLPRRTGKHFRMLADKAELVPLLGLTGEVGTLLSEYKKLLRDGPGHSQFAGRLSEELGDTLWYISSVATKFGLSLDEIARSNLKKVRDRWLTPATRTPFDSTSPRQERLPRRFTYLVRAGLKGKNTPSVSLLDIRNRQVGDLLTDNSHRDDGYRFHDVMHFSFAAVLGWSPVARKLLGRKRRSHPQTDEVEDGGRASVVEEAIVAMIFDYIHHDLNAVKGITRIDSETLRSIRALTRGFEVNVRTAAEWEEAILKGLNVWRQVEANNGGVLIGHMSQRSFGFRARIKRMATPDGRRRKRDQQPRRQRRRRIPSSSI